MATKEFEEMMQRMTNEWNKEPTPRTGQCKVCHGVITETFHRESLTPDIIGPGRGSRWVSSGLSCKDCGLMYAKVPFTK